MHVFQQRPDFSWANKNAVEDFIHNGATISLQNNEPEN